MTNSVGGVLLLSAGWVWPLRARHTTPPTSVFSPAPCSGYCLCYCCSLICTVFPLHPALINKHLYTHWLSHLFLKLSSLLHSLIYSDFFTHTNGLGLSCSCCYLTCFLIHSLPLMFSPPCTVFMSLPHPALCTMLLPLYPSSFVSHCILSISCWSVSSPLPLSYILCASSSVSLFLFTFSSLPLATMFLFLFPLPLLFPLPYTSPQTSTSIFITTPLRGVVALGWAVISCSLNRRKVHRTPNPARYPGTRICRDALAH